MSAVVNNTALAHMHTHTPLHLYTHTHIHTHTQTHTGESSEQYKLTLEKKQAESVQESLHHIIVHQIQKPVCVMKVYA